MAIKGMDTTHNYLRLYCAINELPMIPKRCRVCGEELDAKWEARKKGYICLRCLRQKRLDNKGKHSVT